MINEQKRQPIHEKFEKFCKENKLGVAILTAFTEDGECLVNSHYNVANYMEHLGMFEYGKASALARKLSKVEFVHDEQSDQA